MRTGGGAGRIGAVGVGVVALVAAGGGTATARALPTFGPHRGVHASQTTTASDPTAQVTDAYGNPVNQPRAQITSTTAVDDATTVTLSLRVAQWTDPAADPNWRSGYTGIDWEIDTTVPGSDEYDAVFTGNPQGAGPVGVVLVRTGATSATVACVGGATDSAADSTYTISFPASCIGSPGQFRWSATMVYDPNPSDTTGASADGETVPVSATDPVPEGEPIVVAGGTAPASQGYWLTASDGEVFNHGTAGFYGAPTNLTLNAPVVSMAASAHGHGYYLVGADGGVFAYGDAGFFGSTGSLHLNAPVVAVVPTTSGMGYWLVARDGGVFAFGDATFHGSEGGARLNAPVIGAARSAGGDGYYMVASDGGVFAFGDAAFKGSTGGLHLDQPVVGMSTAPGTDGYWLVASDGGVFAFGASFHGSMGGTHLNAPVVGITPSATGGGYRMVAADGGLFSFGDAEFDGSEATSGLGDVFAATAPSA